MPHSINDGNRSEAELRVRLEKAIIAAEAEKALYGRFVDQLRREDRELKSLRRWNRWLFLLCILSFIFSLWAGWWRLRQTPAVERVQVRGSGLYVPTYYYEPSFTHRI